MANSTPNAPTSTPEWWAEQLAANGADPATLPTVTRLLGSTLGDGAPVRPVLDALVTSGAATPPGYR